MIAEYNVLSNTISVLSNNILCICIQEPHLILKKFIVLLHTLQHITAHSIGSSSSFTRLIPRNVCVEAEGMMKPVKTF